MATPLATLADAQARVGRTLDDAETARLTVLLTDASARIRAHLGAGGLEYPAKGQVTQTAKVRPGGIVRLGLIPVDWSVDPVVTAEPGGQVIPATQYGSAGLIAGIAGGAVINWPGDINEEAYGGGGWFPWWLPATVQVVYTAGYDPIPDPIVAVCCQAALRALQQFMPLQMDASGGSATSAPPPGGVWLMSDEKKELDQTIPRIPVGPISMYGPTAPEPTL